MKKTGIAACIVIITCTCAEAAATEEQQDHAITSPPEACRVLCSQIPRITLESLAPLLPGDGRVFVREKTYPLFFFHYLPGMSFTAGKELSLECHSVFSPARIAVAEAASGIENIAIYEDAACNTEERGVWTQLSPIVKDPISGDYGVFVRVTQTPCAAIGGNRYWATVKSREELIVTKVVDLNVVEF